MSKTVFARNAVISLRHTVLNLHEVCGSFFLGLVLIKEGKMREQAL